MFEISRVGSSRVGSGGFQVSRVGSGHPDTIRLVYREMIRPVKKKPWANRVRVLACARVLPLLSVLSCKVDGFATDDRCVSKL